MKLIKVFAICLALSSLAALAQTSTRAVDLSKLELLNRIVVPGHGLGSFPNRAAFSPNGKGLVTQDTLSLIWWEVSTGEQLQRWKLPDIFQLRGFIDRKTVLLLENEKQFKLFDLETGKMRFDPRNGLDAQPEWAKKLDSPDKSVYLILDGDSPILVDAKTNKIIRRFGHVITDFAVAPNGDVVTGSQAGTIRTWNTKTGKETSRFAGEDKGIKNLVISPNGQLIATNTEKNPNIVKIWNLNGQLLHEVLLPKKESGADKDFYFASLRFSADGKILALSFSKYPWLYSSSVFLIRVRDGSQMNTPLVNQNSSLYFTNKSDVLLQEEILLGNCETKKSPKRRLSIIRIDNGNPVWVGDWRESNYQDWIFSPDGSTFARTLEVFDTKFVDLHCADDIGRGNAIGVSSIETSTGKGLGWFKINAYAQTNSDAKDIYNWRPRIYNIAPDNRTLLTATYYAYEGSEHFGIRLHDLKNRVDLVAPKALTEGYKIRISMGDGGHFPEFKFSSDGRYLMVWADNRIDVWGTRDRQAIFKGR